jgi:FAD/FMN-containing dehydrogenase
MKRRTFLRSSLAAAAAATVPAGPLRAAAFRPARHFPQDIEAVTGDGRSVTLSRSAIGELADALGGRVLLAGEAGYDDARRILNPSFDRYPALIAQVTGAADVRTAVDFARDNGGLLLAVKCGGHSASGQSTCNRGMMIDLSPFRSVRVDPVARTARVTGGSLLGALDHEAMAYGLVTPMGTVSHTGVGGLVTGGGFGRVARRFGLSVDNVNAVDVVTADGQFRRSNSDENADLFWGVRGGGGFAQRDAMANMLCFVDWAHGSDPSAHIEWIRRYWTALEPFTHGFYVNDLVADMTAGTIRENYRQNHDRLVQVKNRYDPTNLFRLNANIAPSV